MPSHENSAENNTENAPRPFELPDDALIAPSLTDMGETGGSDKGGRVRASPLVRHLARQHGINLAQISGSGPQGRIVETDVLAVITNKPAALVSAPASPAAGRTSGWGKRRVWFWTLLGLLAGVPLVLTLIGALTSPPHVRGIPNGHLVYLEADAPSEKTTTLRGLFVTRPGTAPRLLVHEDEPQEIDGGVREWITQPALSPDGTRLAFEKQLITLGEEQQTIENQIWVMPLATGDASRPHLVMDLTRQKMKQIVGLAWDSDSSVLFLEDGTEYSVPTDSPEAPLPIPLDLHGLTLATTPTISATRAPTLTEAGGFAYSVQTPTGPQVLIQNAGKVAPGPAASLFALSPDGGRLAFVPPGTSGLIRLYDIAKNQDGPDLQARWGWSVFGRRRITSLRWSPDGAQIAFTVSKPPVPEDEIFLVDIASGKTVQLPYRAGRAAWDWAK